MGGIRKPPRHQAMIEPTPVTYKMIGKDAPDPNAAVVCNCKWDEGHEESCDIVKAHDLLMNRGAASPTS